jgi:hypothetical protein
VCSVVCLLLLLLLPLSSSSPSAALHMSTCARPNHRPARQHAVCRAPQPGEYKTPTPATRALSPFVCRARSCPPAPAPLAPPPPPPPQHPLLLLLLLRLAQPQRTRCRRHQGRRTPARGGRSRKCSRPEQRMAAEQGRTACHTRVRLSRAQRAHPGPPATAAPALR